jgi:hypothetical protein
MLQLSDDHPLDDPETILAFATAEAAGLRQQYATELMHNRIPNQGAVSIARKAIWATYTALQHSLLLPAYTALLGRYQAQNMELSWLIGFQLRTPGTLFPTLPDNTLVIPVDKLPHVRATLSLRIQTT